jgi:[protein-PII] uridylyltransferase
VAASPFSAGRAASIIAEAQERATVTMPSSSEIPVTYARPGKHLTVALDGIRFVDPDSAALQPSIWIDAFRVAVASGRAVSHDLRTCVQDSLQHFSSEDFTASESDRQAVLDLMVPRPGGSARLHEMAECGLLERLFPELQQIHRKATLEVLGRNSAGIRAVVPVRGLEALRNPSSAARARFSGLLEELRSPELLTLALLLHDVGTRRDHGHPRETLRLAQPAVDRLQLQPAASEALQFLIRHHRQMARVAFRRDAEHPDVVAKFATLVGSEELLKMLCLLTLVDIESIGQDALTPWKEDRLWRLYTDASTRLAIGQADETAEQDRAGLAVAMAGRPEDISEAELARFVTGLPRAYLSVFGLATIYGHVRLARGILPHEVHASLEQHGSVCELTVVTLDKPRLFPNIAGVLSYFGMDIHHGQAMTTPEGLVLAVFEFTDVGGFLAQQRGAPRQMQRMLEAVVAGSVDVVSLLRDKARALLQDARRSLTFSIHLDNDRHEEGTALEIVADDAPGLLYRITRVIADAGCAVDLALVSTEHGKAVDVLRITRDGRKLTEPDQQALHQQLERALSGDQPWP